jgi:hydroxymethylglutaryl-CoA reductase
LQDFQNYPKKKNKLDFVMNTDTFRSHCITDEKTTGIQMKNTKLHDEFIENTITHFYIPLGVAPNFQLTQHSTIPMAIEKLSCCCRSKSANYWSTRRWF